eukprot:GHVN01030191.1.p1 GENE.GHVN01030191.1~~GHVN01030191.1.p1  ORF type:complete len:129 (+),score=41.34 GHVN01030191.1:441-827(+)
MSEMSEGSYSRRHRPSSATSSLEYEHPGDAQRYVRPSDSLLGVDLTQLHSHSVVRESNKELDVTYVGDGNLYSRATRRHSPPFSSSSSSHSLSASSPQTSVFDNNGTGIFPSTNPRKTKKTSRSPLSK